MYLTNKYRPLTNDVILKYCPAAGATTPHESRSDRFGLINTMHMVDVLREYGWHPATVQTANFRSGDRAAYGKHVVRFRQNFDLDPKVNDLIPELVMFNAHDGTTAYQFMAGIFRLVCSNGLVISEGDFGSIRVKHTIRAPEEVEKIVKDLAGTIPVIFGKVDEWRAVELDRNTQLEYAEDAAKLRAGRVVPIAHALLKKRRSQDLNNDLWTTYNVVQENLIRGGTIGNGSKGIRKLRSITNVEHDLDINRKLWDQTNDWALKLAA